MTDSLRKGLRFEDLARRYLGARGLCLQESNYRCRFGEIDLIMRDAETLCFIEVRFRRSLDFGGASASITRAKQRRIIKAALFYLSTKRQSMNQALRFDALLIQQQADGKQDFNWIQNAFYAE
ncbi:MAG: YraN family protein [Gammaproteobacteria bacterium]|jgi:putative endonuclease|nr:YraN family protein [Gammaproteobacteria bacterium]